MQVKVINESGLPLPKYSTLYSAGMDVYADLNSTDGANAGTGFVLEPGKLKIISTGLKMEIPEGYEIQVRARSGLAAKHGISLVNGIGTIDADYRNYVGVILINHGDQPLTINHGDRIAQIVLNKFSSIEWVSELNLSETDRGLGGYGSTGVQTSL